MVEENIIQFPTTKPSLTRQADELVLQARILAIRLLQSAEETETGVAFTKDKL